MAEENVARDRNIALLIDADNASPDSLDPVLTVLAELGTVNIRRAYGNWQKPGLKGWANIVHLHAIEPQQQFDLTKGKSSTDMKMIIDAMDLLYRRPCRRLRNHVQRQRFHAAGDAHPPGRAAGLRLRTARTPEGFRKACTRFIDVGALAKAEAAGRGADTPPATKRRSTTKLVKLLGAAYQGLKARRERLREHFGSRPRAGNRSSFDARNYGYPGLPS